MSIQPTSFQHVSMVSFEFESPLHNWNEQQLRVIQALRQEEQAERVYWYRASGLDQFVVLVMEDTFEIVEHFVDVYIDLLKANMDYPFEIDTRSLHSENKLPPGAIPCW